MSNMKIRLTLLLLLACTTSCDKSQRVWGGAEDTKMENKWRRPKCALPRLDKLHKKAIYLGDSTDVVRSKHREEFFFGSSEDMLHGENPEIANTSIELDKDVWASEIFRAQRGVLISYHLTIRSEKKSSVASTLLDKFDFLKDQLEKPLACQGVEKYWSINIYYHEDDSLYSSEIVFVVD
jgi:hypothetical protein